MFSECEKKIGIVELYATFCLITQLLGRCYYSKLLRASIGFQIDAEVRKTCIIKFLKSWFCSSVVYLKSNASNFATTILTRNVETKKNFLIPSARFAEKFLIVQKYANLFDGLILFLFVRLIVHN